MPDKPRILVLFAHLDLHRSRINRAMLDAIDDLDHVEIHDLLELYPDFYIDVGAERRALVAADLLVLQHPLYWYSAPAIIKHWQDLVLERGFAYGPGGTALHGKAMLQAVSTGGPVGSYQPGGAHGGPLIEYLRPFHQMARFTGMHPLPPLVLQGGLTATDAQIAAHAASYRALLAGFRPPPPNLAPANLSEGT
jgi:glutathione-regulated potassium-efflux system ancillary protein KefG